MAWVRFQALIDSEIRWFSCWLKSSSSSSQWPADSWLCFWKIVAVDNSINSKRRRNRKLANWLKILDFLRIWLLKKYIWQKCGRFLEKEKIPEVISTHSTSSGAKVVFFSGHCSQLLITLPPPQTSAWPLTDWLTDWLTELSCDLPNPIEMDLHLLELLFPFSPPHPLSSFSLTAI